MDFQTIIYWFSDGNINRIANTIFTDFKVLSFVLGTPIIWALRKYYIPWTPWKDGRLIEQIAQKLEVDPQEPKKGDQQ